MNHNTVFCNVITQSGVDIFTDVSKVGHAVSIFMVNNNNDNNNNIYCNWVVTWWQWLFYMYTKHEIGYY